ncbi:uncharacterized protein [Apostichopus japonicus]|uniref:uncharacterized protein isoform X3 n=1 Tax=Stichopus japonicus TaxID=307972 RepID=UPI003AB50882
MAEFRGRQVCQSFLTLLTLWNSLGSEIVVANVGEQSSSSSYFVFQQPEYPRDCKEVLNACTSTHNTSGVYLIKPEGYPEPFEVYCDNEFNNGGWTVLQRRRLDSVNFNRNWQDFKNGFGFLGSEFWIGNEKLAFLTNQKNYQLRFEFENAAGQSYYVTYDQFRISDEWGQYQLSSVGTYGGTAESQLEWCATNKIFSNETCERRCDDPDACISSTSRTELEKCVCVGDYMIQDENCIPQNQCSCFVADKGTVLINGESYINSDCTRRSNCSNNQLMVEDSYHCSDDATCDVRDGVRRCYCIDGYEGDGVTCTRKAVPKDCHELYVDGSKDGVYTIYPDGSPNGIQVFCEMESNGGGWTVIQRRSSAAVDFYRTWAEYKTGFEDPVGDRWLGNDYIHAITNQKEYSLRIDLKDSSSSSYYALYSSFSISDDADKYRLSIGSYSGDTGYDAMSYHNNKQFSTRGEDNDGWSDFDCAEKHRGAWWFGYYYHCASTYSYCRSNCPSHEYYCDYFPVDSGCANCADSHLNGDYDGSTRGTNIFWNFLSGYDCGLQYAEMKIRPVQT